MTNNDLILKNIIRDIIEQCAEVSIDIPDPVVAFIVKVVFLNPSQKFQQTEDDPLSTEQVDRLVATVMRLILTSTRTAIETLKMQYQFATQYSTKEELIHEHKATMKTHLAPIVHDVANTKARSKNELDVLYQKLVLAVVARSGLGHPTDVAVLRESTAALQSIFPLAELGHFMAQSFKEKEIQIRELTEIVMGIRIFNRESQKGGAGIEDIPHLLQDVLAILRDSLDQLVSSCSRFAAKFSTVLIRHCIEKPPAADSNQWKLIDKVRDALIMVRQILKYFSVLQMETRTSFLIVQALKEKLERRLEMLRETVRARQAVPTVQVYPQFMDLALIWIKFQETMVHVTSMKNLLDILYKHVTCLNEVNRNADSLLGRLNIKSEEQRLAENQSRGIDITEFLCDITFPDNVKNLNELPLEYTGFCAWALAKGDGVVCLANPNIGILTWNSKHYIFSSTSAAEEFGKDPEKYIQMVLESARRHPTLFHLLNLEEQVFTSVKRFVTSMLWKQRIISKNEMAVQTETHPITENIDSDYTWNAWELRQRAVHLADLRKKSTHSTQTDKSHLKRDCSTQVWPIKDASTQTIRDNYTNVPQPLTFMFGLRGPASKRPPHIVELTRPIEED